MTLREPRTTRSVRSYSPCSKKSKTSIDPPFIRSLNHASSITTITTRRSCLLTEENVAATLLASENNSVVQPKKP